MKRVDNILEDISNVSHNLRWKDIEHFCNQKGFPISNSKKGHKVRIGNSIWCMHLDHRTSNELKHGIIRELRKILIKEKIINNENITH